MGHEVANGVRVRVAEVWHVIARVALHAWLDPDLLPGQLPCDGHLLLERDAVLSQTFDEAGMEGELVVVVAGDERDLDALTPVTLRRPGAEIRSRSPRKLPRRLPIPDSPAHLRLAS